MRPYYQGLESKAGYWTNGATATRFKCSTGVQLRSYQWWL